MIEFERMIYSDRPRFDKVLGLDTSFLVDKLVNFPKYRPFLINETVQLSKEYCVDQSFKEEFLIRSLYECPVLVHRLFFDDVFSFEQINLILHTKMCSLACYYFRKNIEDFDSLICKKKIPYSYNQEFFENVDKIDELIEFGYTLDSLEYCLKYDQIALLQAFLSDPFGSSTLHTQWSPFEWAQKPSHYDILEFTGYFGSIRCFKSLLINGYGLNEMVLSNIVCSGSIELYHLCSFPSVCHSKLVCLASEYCHYELLRFLIEKGGSINEQDNR